MTHHATFLLGFHCLPNVKKWYEGIKKHKSINVILIYMPSAQGPRHTVTITEKSMSYSTFDSSDGSVCAGSSDHSLLIDGISTNISDIMTTLAYVNEFQR